MIPKSKARTTNMDMDKVNYIVTFTAYLSTKDEQKILYFTDEQNALTVYVALMNAEGIVDCYLSKVVRPSESEGNT